MVEDESCQMRHTAFMDPFLHGLLRRGRAYTGHEMYLSASSTVSMLDIEARVGTVCSWIEWAAFVVWNCQFRLLGFGSLRNRGTVAVSREFADAAVQGAFELCNICRLSRTVVA